jgi:hypothetical protein
MSAICGIFSPTTPINTDDNRLSAMMQVLKPYGQDGEGAWQATTIALGQQTAHISVRFAEETHPAQIGHTVITADARLDNRDELCSRLGILETERAHNNISFVCVTALEFVRFTMRTGTISFSLPATSNHCWLSPAFLSSLTNPTWQLIFATGPVFRTPNERSSNLSGNFLPRTPCCSRSPSTKPGLIGNPRKSPKSAFATKKNIPKD